MTRTREDKAQFHAKLRELAEKLKNDPRVIELHAGTMAGYSRRNVALIVGQKPEATQVAGFHDWRKVGRSVAKGAKAVYVLAPMTRKDDTGESELTGFRAVPVFDISDTVAMAS